MTGTRAKFLVLVQGKTDKQEERTLIFTEHSIHVQIPPTHGKSVVKTELTIPFVDITTISSADKEKFTLKIGEKPYNFRTRATDAIDDVLNMVKHIVLALEYSFPGVSVQKELVKLELSPDQRLKKVIGWIERARRSSTIGPCGGFRTTHDYFRLYFNTPKQDDVIWDVETVYVAQNTKRMCLRDFDHLDPKDWLPIIATMAYNPYFTELDVSNLKLSTDAQTQIINVVKHNRSLESLIMDSCGLKSEFCNRLGQVIPLDSKLTELTLSNNPNLGDIAMGFLCGMLNKLRRSLTVLRLDNCGLTARSANFMAEALGSTSTTANTKLQTLDLSNNSLKGEDLQAFHSMLAQPNSILRLNLSHCDCLIDPLSASLVRGSMQNLTALDLSYNHFNTLTKYWVDLFSSSLALREVNLSHCRMSKQALGAVFLGLSRNKDLTAISLNISSNDLRAPGALELANYLSSVECLVSLDISDNDMNFELSKVFEALMKNSKLQHLTIGSNFNGMRSKQTIEVLEQLCCLLSMDTSALESLSLADARLKTDLTLVINELANNTTLRKLDISGNMMGDLGARTLARVLCINEHLEEIYLDRNGLSLRSLEELAGALEFNHSVRKFQLPVADLAPHLARNGDKVATLLSTIERYIQKNLGPKKFSAEKAFNLAQGFQRNASQQYLDQVVVNLEKYCSRLESTTTGAASDDFSVAATMEMVHEARLVLNDARASRNLLARLQDASSDVLTKGPQTMQRKVKVFAKELQSEVETQLKSVLEEMISVSLTECPAVCNKDSLTSESRESSGRYLRLPKDFVKKLLDRSLDSEISSKMNEVSLALASNVTDSVLDNLIAKLDDSLQRLTRNWTSLVRAQKRATESQRNTVAALQRPDSLLSVDSAGTSAGADVSPVSMRKSIVHTDKAQRESVLAQCRRRPQSSILLVTGDDEEDEEEKTEAPESITSVIVEDEEEEQPPTPEKEKSSSKGSKPFKNIFQKKSSPKKSNSTSKPGPTTQSHVVNLDTIASDCSTASPLVHPTRARPKPRRSKANTPTRGVANHSPSGLLEASFFSDTTTGPSVLKDPSPSEEGVGAGRPSREQTPDSGVEEEAPTAKVRSKLSVSKDDSSKPVPPSTSPPASPPPSAKASRPRSGIFVVPGPVGLMAELMQRQNKQSPATTPTVALARSVTSVAKDESVDFKETRSQSVVGNTANSKPSVSSSSSKRSGVLPKEAPTGPSAVREKAPVKPAKLKQASSIEDLLSSDGDKKLVGVVSRKSNSLTRGVEPVKSEGATSKARSTPPCDNKAPEVEKLPDSTTTPEENSSAVKSERPLSVRERSALYAKQNATPPPIPPNKPTRVPSNKPIGTIGARDSENNSDDDIEILV